MTSADWLEIVMAAERGDCKTAKKLALSAKPRDVYLALTALDKYCRGISNHRAIHEALNEYLHEVAGVRCAAARGRWSDIRLAASRSKWVKYGKMLKILRLAPPWVLASRQNESPAVIDFIAEVAELGAYDVAFGVNAGNGILTIPEVVVPTRQPYGEYVRNILSRALELPDEVEFSKGKVRLWWD